MTDANATVYETHPLHTLISWPAVIAGAAVAVAAGAMLNLLGVALGAGALNPFDLTRGGAKAFTVGAGLWIALANAVALFAGGLVASRAAKYADHHRGMLHGLIVWAVAFLVAIFVAGSTAAGGVTAALGGAASNPVAAEAAAPAPAATDPSIPTGVLQSDGSIAPADASAMPQAAPVTSAPRAAVAQKAADTTGALALWSFLTMLLGAVAAVFGGRYGSRTHAWETRARHAEPLAPHLPPRL
jgi:hypothetical protein